MLSPSLSFTLTLSLLPSAGHMMDGWMDLLMAELMEGCVYNSTFYNLMIHNVAGDSEPLI